MMARPNPRRRIDILAEEAARALELRREVVLLDDHALTQAATVRRSDIERAVDLWHEANAGTDMARLLDGPAREDEADG